MSRLLQFAFLIFFFVAAAVLTGCDSSLVPCENYFGARLLDLESPPSNGQPTQLVLACMYGADQVGPVILHQSTYQIECARKYNLDELRKDSPDAMAEINNTIELADACGIGARGFVRTVLRMDETPAALNQCRDIRGKYGINPRLPCT